MNHKSFFATIAICMVICPIVAFADSADVYSDCRDIYTWITEVSIGPLECDSIVDSCHYYRLVITTVEIYAHPYLEFIGTDDEAFGRKVINHYEFLIDNFKYNGEISEIKVENWLNYNTVRIQVAEKRFLLQLKRDLAKSTIEEIPRN